MPPPDSRPYKHVLMDWGPAYWMKNNDLKVCGLHLTILMKIVIQRWVSNRENLGSNPGHRAIVSTWVRIPVTGLLL